jgi:hypothetical protein
METINNRNNVAQVIRLKDGSQKVIFHNKRFGGWGDFKSFWNSQNSAPKQNSKRQQKLRAAGLTY